MVPIRQLGFHSARRGAAGAAAVLLAIAGLAACSAQSTTSGQRDDIILGRAMDLTTLDPTARCATRARSTLGRLRDRDQGRRPERARPALRRSWEANDNTTQFTFNLDPGAVFADGARSRPGREVVVGPRQGPPGAPVPHRGDHHHRDAGCRHRRRDSEEPNSAFLSITSAPYMGIANSDLAVHNGHGRPQAATTTTPSSGSSPTRPAAASTNSSRTAGRGARPRAQRRVLGPEGGLLEGDVQASQGLHVPAAATAAGRRRHRDADQLRRRRPARGRRTMTAQSSTRTTSSTSR